jgi:hypothetical protein
MSSENVHFYSKFCDFHDPVTVEIFATTPCGIFPAASLPFVARFAG